MKIRYLGHSCVEIIGQHHILIDPDFMRNPDPGVEYICISHAHKDHIGRVAEVPTGIVLASSDVCEIAEKMGVPHTRLRPVTPGEQVDNISILPGYSMVDQPVYTF
ncbi:MAG TPA: MBL fold metallo-hydrolase, partial [Bellilinea sp.]|nr:MBL fold metallo-hydrolase [Bellilinea sp.]